MPAAFKRNGLKSFITLFLLTGGLTFLCLLFLYFGLQQSSQKTFVPVSSIDEKIDISTQEDGVIPPASLAIYEKVRQEYENRLAQSVQSLLEKVVGAGKAEVSIRADIDFSQQTTNREVLDTDAPALKSSKMAADGYEETEYAFSKQSSHTIQNGGVIRRLSIAVLVDESAAALTQTLQNQLRVLVERATGFDAERGDLLELIPTTFTQSSSATSLDKEWVRLAEFVFLSILLIVGFLMVVMKSFFPLREKETSSVVDSGAMLPAFVRPEVVATAGSSPINGAVNENALQKAQEIVEKNPQEALDVLRGWMSQSLSKEEATRG